MKKILLTLLLLFESAFSDSVSIVFLGDTYFGESYQTGQKFNRGENVINKYGYDYFFQNVKDLLTGADLVFANLETPLTTYEIDYTSNKKYIHFSNADSTPFYLAKYNIGAVSLANNHIFDLGFKGFETTAASLNSYSISSFGAGYNETEAFKPFTKRLPIGKNEFEIFVFGCYWHRKSFAEKNYYASENSGGVNLLEPGKIINEVKKIKESNPSAFVIVYSHWGSNYREANVYQSEIAIKLIEGGVDLIIGHGAHRIQKIENYKGKWIIYNIGNFIFNSPGRYEKFDAKPCSFIVKLEVSEKKDKTLKLYPVFTDNLKTNYQIRLVNETEFKKCNGYLINTGLSKNDFKKIDSKYFQVSLN
ncbi:MAG: CapA family protein [Chlorobi bacterium]|nr:CapA family protein [Chlorobiota bacterium]MCI0716385.1 CapA family protein [Chlorobiota bacterium]